MSDCFRAGVTSQKRFVQVACLLATAAAVAAFYTNTLPLPTWEVTAVRYHEVGLNWRHLSASATLLVNLTVQSSSVFPLWFERTSVDLFFPGPQGERRPLGVGSFGGMFLTCGKNYVEVSPRSNRTHLYHGSLLYLTRKAFCFFIHSDGNQATAIWNPRCSRSSAHQRAHRAASSFGHGFD